MSRIGIYRISTPSGKTYIGSSIDVRRRKWQHIGTMRNGTHENVRLQNSANKYGVDLLHFEHVCCLLPGQSLAELEQLFIDEEKPRLNMSKFAMSPSRDPEVAKRMSAAAKSSIRHNEARKRNAPKAWAALRKPVIRLDDGRRYESAYAAAKDAGNVKFIDTIFTALKNWQKFGGCYYAYEDSGLTLEVVLAEVERREVERKKNAAAAMIARRCRAVVRLTDGAKFISLAEAARATGSTHTGISKSIKNARPFKGERWAYADDPTA